MSSEDSLTPSQLKTIAHQALTFQRYVFRRAWGVYYAVWTVAIVVFTFGYDIPLAAMFPASLGWIPYALLYGGVGTVAGAASFWIFGSAWKTLKLRKAVGEDDEKMRRKYIALIALWSLAVYIAIGVSFTLFSAHAFTVLYGALFTVEIFLFYQLRASFPNKVPIEGRIALVSYGISTTLSLAMSILGLNPVLFTPVWILTIGAWFYSALYGLRHAPDELVELTNW